MPFGLVPEPGSRECSRAGCRAEAVHAISWRNPKIHSADRVKVWHACEEHVDYLRDYLDTRDFPVIVAVIGTTVDVVPDRSAALPQSVVSE